MSKSPQAEADRLISDAQCDWLNTFLCRRANGMFRVSTDRQRKGWLRLGETTEGQLWRRTIHNDWDEDYFHWYAWPEAWGGEKRAEGHGILRHAVVDLLTTMFSIDLHLHAQNHRIVVDAMSRQQRLNSSFFSKIKQEKGRPE